VQKAGVRRRNPAAPATRPWHGHAGARARRRGGRARALGDRFPRRRVRALRAVTRPGARRAPRRARRAPPRARSATRRGRVAVHRGRRAARRGARRARGRARAFARLARVRCGRRGAYRDT
jgi:hypothetical protein